MKAETFLAQSERGETRISSSLQDLERMRGAKMGLRRAREVSMLQKGLSGKSGDFAGAPPSRKGQGAFLEGSFANGSTRAGSRRSVRDLGRVRSITSIVTFCMPWFPLMGADPLPRADRGAPPSLAFSHVAGRHHSLMAPSPATTAASCHAKRTAEGRPLAGSFLTSIRSVSGGKNFCQPGSSVQWRSAVGASGSQLPSGVWGHKALPACGVRGLSTMKAAPDPDSPWAFLDPDEVEFMEDDDVRAALTDRGLSVSGSGEVLKDRLIEALESEFSEMDDIGEVRVPPLMGDEVAGETTVGEMDLDEWDALDVEEMSLDQLKQAIRAAGLAEGGKRPEMEDRLIEWFAERDETWESAHPGGAAAQGLVEEEDAVAARGGVEGVEGDDEFDEISVSSMTVPEIKAALKKRGLKVGGTKQILVGRLMEALSGGEEGGEGADQGGAPERKMSAKEQILAAQARTVAARAEAEAAQAPGGGGDPSARSASLGGGDVDTEGVLGAFDSALDEWFGSEEGELGRVRKVGMKGICPGCGCLLQSAVEKQPGYVPASKMDKPDAVCVRCYGLQHYGKVDSELTAQKGVHDVVSPEAFRRTLAPIRKKKCIICYVCDVFDFHGTFLPDLTTLVGDNPVVLAVNKADLLPKNYNQERVKRWVRTCANALGSPRVVDVVMISAKQGYGVDLLENQLRSWSTKRKQDVYILGAANVGKSTLVNRIMSRGMAPTKIVEDKKEKIDKLYLASEEDLEEAAKGNMQWIDNDPGDIMDELEDPDFDEDDVPDSLLDNWAKSAGQQEQLSAKELDEIGKRQYEAAGILESKKQMKEIARIDRKEAKEWEFNMLKGKEGGVTTSHLPGTTIGLTELELGNDHSIFDTPGLIVPMQLTNRLIMEELDAVLPQRRIEHVTYRVPVGSCVHLGGLCRLDNIGGKPFFFTIFVGNQVTIHVGKIEKAEEYRYKHVGKLAKPPYTPERLDEIGPLVPNDLWAEGVSFERGCIDVIFAGLGWICLSGRGRCELTAWAPEGVGVMTRTPLMPFEALSSTESFSGAEKKGSSRRSKKLKGSLKQRAKNLFG